MKKINIKTIIIFLLLLLPIIVLLSTTTKNFISNSNKTEKQADDEIELDNWEISTVFYDSTVDNGNTPLTEVNWDASTGDTGEGAEREIKVQITYKNSNTITRYEKDKLTININNLGYGSGYWSVSILAGVNDSAHEGYDWNFVPQYVVNGPFTTLYRYPTNMMEEFSFTNNNIIEEKSNCEGTIQILYKLKPYSIQGRIPQYEDVYSASFTKNIQANINGEVEGNTIIFNYQRNENTPWQRKPRATSKTANKISSYDGLGTNPEDYIWVKYRHYFNYDFRYYANPYPYINESYYLLEGVLPEGCIGFDEDLNEIVKDENNKYTIKVKRYSGYSKEYFSYIGYPKSIYNEENDNLSISDTTKFYVAYEDNEIVYQMDVTTNINLNDFAFAYSGNLYGISKQFRKTTYSYISARDNIYYDSLIGEDLTVGNGGKAYQLLSINAKYTGKKMDVKFGDDLLYILGEDNNYRRLQDDEYYYSRISFPSSFINGNEVKIANEKYDCELWVRKANQTNFTKEESFKNVEQKNWEYSKEDKIVEYYFVIKDLNESIRNNSSNSYDYSIITINNASNISESGRIYNFAYLQVFFDGVLQNPTTIDNYSTLITKNEIASYDIEKYGSYIQRGTNYVEYTKYTLPTINNYMKLLKGMGYRQISDQEKFEIYTYLRLRNSTDGVYPSANDVINHPDMVKEENMLHGWEFFDILPEEFKLVSTPEDIINSFSTYSIGYDYYGVAFDSQTGFKKMSQSDFVRLIKDNTRVEIIKNYKNSNRTYIKIVVDLKNHPILFFHYSFGQTYANFTIKSELTYDDILEKGNVITNNGYAKFHNREFYTNNFLPNVYETTIKDNGAYEPLAADIDQDGKEDDDLSYASAKLTITSVLSTNQDVQVSAKANNSSFDTSRINVENENEYEYKLRIRTGTADVTNLVIYDSLEDYAKNPDLEIVKAAGSRRYWQGEFLGVDTTFAESKGYTVKVYYNENAKPGTLKDDNGWQIYSDSVDKTKVKILAFEYLNAEGTAPAVLPANSLTYVLINMKSPVEEYTTFAYNGCWTEWNAIDPVTEQPVDFITGINSNIVRVALPSSVELEDINLTLTKVWIDNSNSLTKRPANVKFNLITNDDYQNPTEVTLSGTGNTWTNTITVPKYDDDGKIINYSITEDTISLTDGYKYIPVVDNTTVTNTLYKTITITKNWKDNTNAYLTRPTNVTVKVYQNGNYYKDLIVSGNYSTNTWTGSLTVPVFDNNGNEYTYTVDEAAVDNYQTTCENLVCTNTLTGNKNITVKKEWKDNNNAYQTRPSSINIYLKQNGNAYKTVTLTGTGNTWESDSITVPMYDSNGVKYTYTVDENQLAAYGLVTYDQNNLKVTNTLKQNNTITITKNWYDNNNAYSTRPQSLRVKVLQNNSDYQTVTLTGTGNTWTTDLDVPKYDNNQQAYVYKIQEIDTDIKDEYTDVSYSNDSLTVTNKLKKNITLTVKKVWIDNDNELGLRPNSLQLTILQNGNDYKTITLSGDSSTWTQDIEVPKYDDSQKEYKYSIKEITDDSLSEYANVSYSTDDLTVTNTLSSNMLLTITKIWVDNDNELGLRPNELTITLLQNGNDYKTITLTGDTSTWSTEVEVPKYDDNQHKYTYTIKEITDNLNSDYSDITYSETDLSVTNKLKKNNDLTITKVWIDDNNKHLTRPDFVEVQVYQNGKEYKKAKLSSDSNWKSTIKDVPTYDSKGAKYTYTIKEPEPIEYYDKVTIDQTTLTITNELTEEPKVNLYFTVVNGYTEPGSDEIKYDEDGLHDVLRKYNIDPDQEYLFTFKLENVETNEVYEGKLSSKGVLEFKGIPYGSYKAIEGEDEFFDFVSMLGIDEVLGIKIEPEKNGGIITIEPTGKTTTYGINIVNKIPVPIQHIEQQEENPNTLTSIIKLTIVSIIVIISLIFILQSYKKYSFLKE